MADSNQVLIKKLTDLELVNAVHNMMLKKAQRLDLIAIQLQILAVVVNIAGLLIGMRYQIIVPLVAGIIVAIPQLIWLILSQQYHRSRSIGEWARRLHLMADGLGKSISSDEIAQLYKDADATDEELRPYIQENFFPDGPEGIHKLITDQWDSAFFSESLLKKAGRLCRAVSWIILGFLVIGVVAIARFTLIYASDSKGDMLTNIILTGGLLAIFIELFQRANNYEQASEEITPMVEKLRSLYVSHKPDESELFTLIDNYNAAVQGAPSIPYFIFVKNRDKLNKLFDAIKEAADKEKASHRKP